MITTPVQGLLLDLDGTLVDSAPDIMRVLNLVLASHNRRQLPLSEVLDMVGDGIPTLVERGLVATGGINNDSLLASSIAECLHHYSAEPVVNTTVYPGVSMTLETLRDAGIKLAVCTNKATAIATQVLQQLDLLQYFPVVVGGDSLDVKKPDKRHLEYTLRQINCQQDNAAMVGDSRNDILAANNAQLPAVLVSWGYHNADTSDLNIDWKISRFAELGALTKHI